MPGTPVPGRDGDLPALAAIRAALEEALGMKFEGARGDHFFRSALVQTLFYGVFSAWVLWASAAPTDSRPFRLAQPRITSACR